jgi:hypothetical protein
MWWLVHKSQKQSEVLKKILLISARHPGYYYLLKKHMLIALFKSSEGTEYLVVYSATFLSVHGT